MTDATDKQIRFAQSLGIENPEQFSKQALRELIDKKIGGKVQATKADAIQERPTYKKFDKSSYYVSYAKDLFVAMVPMVKDLEAVALMKICVDCIKLAKSELQQS